MLFQQNLRRLLVHTPAKLNLYLEVIGRREDGYHELETCMVAVDLYDTLRFRPLPDGTPLALSVRSTLSEQIPEDADNLVLKAANLLREHCGTDQAAAIQLHKRIPSQAGMGGGSSDAAATLHGLNRLWNLGRSTAQLHELGSQLGSDINFFIEQSPAAACLGRGERIEPIVSPSALHFVVAMPDAGLSTAEVFRNCEFGEPRDFAGFVDGFRAGQPSLHNRLSPTAARLCPAISQVQGHFDRVGIPNQLTGSGSAWFGVVQNKRVGARLVRTLRGRGLRKCWAVSMTA